jgi:hypothetical protein
LATRRLLVQSGIVAGVVASLAVGAWAATVKTTPDKHVTSARSISDQRSSNEASAGTDGGYGGSGEYGYGYGYGGYGDGGETKDPRPRPQPYGGGDYGGYGR